MDVSSLQPVGECLWEIPRQGAMRVPVRLVLSPAMLSRAVADRAPEQAMQVAELPGIQVASLAMPDMHWGYGFPIGGVAAFDAEDGVVSPGGVGYDINCGVRLLASGLDRQALLPRREALVEALFKGIPSGVGAGGRLHLSASAYRAVGQPVLIPGDMGTCSYVLAGTAKAMEETFGSACHGAGRRMSRSQAIKAARGRDVGREIERSGVVLRARSRETVAEEMPEAYKDVAEVVDACQRAGSARRVPRLRPLAVIKG